MQCYFNGCNFTAAPGSWKCKFHMQRNRCKVQDCHNQVYARLLCVKHGGKLKCQVDGCDVNCRVGKFCTKHSPPEALRYCSVEGCSSHAHLAGKCFRHGGGRRCAFPDCTKFARRRGFCARHTSQEPPSKDSSSREQVVPPQNAIADVQSLLAYYYQDLGNLPSAQFVP
ncbi:hypothetical protein AeRB84_012872 [Aphanomyces euteiches]|nr:hypothetical protein AeRB84_012872 [Aphanomyces euteiches]